MCAMRRSRERERGKETRVRIEDRASGVWTCIREAIREAPRDRYICALIYILADHRTCGRMVGLSLNVIKLLCEGREVS